MSYTCNLKKYFDNLWHVALLIVVTCLFAFPTRADELERVLATLDQAIDSADVYTAHRQELINQLMRDRRQAGTDMNAVLAINERLAGEYKSFICDSTTKYYNENIALARALGDTRVENNTKMRLSYHLASSGIYEAALDLLRSIDKRQLANSQLINYYRGFDHVYGEMAYNHLRDVSILRYKELAAAYKDSLNAIIDRDDPRWLEMEETRLRDAGKFVEAMKINDRRLSQCSTGTPQYALVMFQRSLVERAVSSHTGGAAWRRQY